MGDFFSSGPETLAGAIVWLAALFVVAFLLGSIPWGIVISKLFYKKDIRDEGSGNIGTTNAMRSLGRVGGSAVFVLDFAKGVLAGLLGWGVAFILEKSSSELGYPAVASVVALFHATDASSIGAFATSEAVRGLCGSIAFIGCVWGHVFSPWLHFKGGKGIAVAVGCFIFFAGPIPTLIEVVAFAIAVAISRYISLGSIVAAVLCAIFCIVLFWGNWLAVIFGFVTACTILWAHRKNMVRLVHGTERRIGDKKTDSHDEAQVS